jgi:hypothetical protein
MTGYYFNRLITMLRMAVQGLPTNFNVYKKELIDYTFRHGVPAPASFADLGGIWNVHGAYTFYTLRQYQVSRACLVDSDFTEAALKKSQSDHRVNIIRGNFGEDAVAEQIGQVDAIFLFDVLLHQVKPDWNEILAKYAGQTRYFIIYNQQWTDSKHTVRLLDLGREEYFKNVPHPPDHPTYQALFENMDQIHPQHKRIWRDIHNVWQWGITDYDLFQVMEGLGYTLQFYKNCGRFGKLPHFENHACVFQKC